MQENQVFSIYNFEDGVFVTSSLREVSSNVQDLSAPELNDLVRAMRAVGEDLGDMPRGRPSRLDQIRRIEEWALMNLLKDEARSFGYLERDQAIGDGVPQSEGEPTDGDPDDYPHPDEAEADGGEVTPLNGDEGEADGESESDGDGDGDDMEPAFMMQNPETGVIMPVPVLAAAALLNQYLGGPSGSGTPPDPQIPEGGFQVPEQDGDGTPPPPPEDDERTQHFAMPEALAALAAGQHLYLYGPAGSGKSEAGLMYGRMVGRRVEAVSGHPHMTRSEIVGYKRPNGEWENGPLARAIMFCLLFMFDEFDAASPSAGVLLNMVTANNCIQADEMLYADAGFRVIATANTVGNGATSEFIGRNPIDKATMTRFASIHWPTDYALERYIVRRTLGLELSLANEWLTLLGQMRHNIEAYGLKTDISMRAAINGGRELAAANTPEYKASGLPKIDVMMAARHQILNKIPEEQQIKVLDGC